MEGFSVANLPKLFEQTKDRLLYDPLLWIKRWWSGRYSLPLNHPLLSQTTERELFEDWLSEKMEIYLATKEEASLEGITFEDLFPEEDSFAKALQRAKESGQYNSFHEMYEAVKAQFPDEQ